jgi:hypothetical protein
MITRHSGSLMIFAVIPSSLWTREFSKYIYNMVLLMILIYLMHNVAIIIITIIIIIIIIIIIEWLRKKTSIVLFSFV